MYVVVIAFIQDEDDFDFRIMREKMLRAKVLTRASKNQDFTEDVYINEAIKKGE